MTQPSVQSPDLFGRKVSTVLGELAKGMKTVRQYPAGHPSLLSTMDRVAVLLEALPLPQGGLELAVTRAALLLDGTPLPSPPKAVEDLHRELYLRRAGKLILQPGVSAAELSSFLAILSIEPREVQEKGGLERLLHSARCNHVWVNRVDYEALAEALKREELEEEEEEIELIEEEEEGAEEEDPALDESRPAVERLLIRLSREVHPEAYASLADGFLTALSEEQEERRLHYSAEGCAVFLRHHGSPPDGSPVIAARAREGIRSLATIDVVEQLLRRVNDRGDESRVEVESILVLMGEKVAAFLLEKLGSEGDLTVRKSIVEVIARIGQPAAAAVRHHLHGLLRKKGEWYSLRNVLTIMGRLAFPDFAHDITEAFLSEDERFRDPRVRREAIRALGRIPDPDALDFLSALTFDSDEGTRLAATAALGMKREAEAVEALHRRATARSGLFSLDYRLAHEAIDALRTIGTAEALGKLEELLSFHPAFFIRWETKGTREMKLRVLHCISRMEGQDARDALRRVAGSGKGFLKAEAERLVRRAERAS